VTGGVSGARGAFIALGALLGVTAVAAAGVLTKGVLIARRVLTPPTEWAKDGAIVAIGDGEVTLTRSAMTEWPGRYGMFTRDDRGYAKVGDVIRGDEHTVTRELVAIEDEPVRAGMAIRMGAAYYRDPRELGLPTEDVRIGTPLGPAPAWLVPAAEDAIDDGAWAILVHGRDAGRWETIRAIPPIRESGRTTLVVSYRNDPGAPRDPDGRYALGLREWLDVEAAMRFALERGAKRFVLGGWSMGGATVLQLVRHSELAGLVEGVLLDSPAIDWRAVLRFQGAILGLSHATMAAVEWAMTSPLATRLVGQSAAIDLDALDTVAHSGALTTPILVLFSEDDGVAPIAPARALAAARPDLVELREFTGARHVRIWNRYPEAYESAIADWLSRLPPRA